MTRLRIIKWDGLNGKGIKQLLGNVTGKMGIFQCRNHAGLPVQRRQFIQMPISQGLALSGCILALTLTQRPTRTLSNQGSKGIQADNGAIFKFDIKLLEGHDRNEEPCHVASALAPR